MTTLIDLRGDGEGLPSMHQYGRDDVRQYLYQRVFDYVDGSSSLSRENPSALIEVGGVLVTRQNLHDEIIYFLEDQLDSMTEPSPTNIGNPQAPAAYRYEGQNVPTNNYANNGISNNNGSNFDQQRHNTDGASGEPLRTLGIRNHSQAERRLSPIPSFEGLNIGGPPGHNTIAPANGSRHAWDNSGLSETPNLRDQPQPGFLMPQGLGQGPPGPQLFPYGQSFVNAQQQQYLAMLHQQAQQLGQFPQPQFANPPGMLPGRYYLPLHPPPVTFIPGRQGMPHIAPVLPYSPQTMPNNPLVMGQLGGPMMQPNFLQNPSMALSPFQPQLPSWPQQPPRMLQSSTPRYGQLGPHMYRSASRTSSPANQTRRNVVPEVALLPYRPGSDDMYPHSIGGMSVRLQELTRNGNPSFAAASMPDIIPFAENARHAKVAEWGVLKIGNVSLRG